VPNPADERPLPNPDDIRGIAFWQALDAVPTGLVVVDQAGGIAFINSAAERMFLYERNEWQGRTIEALVPVARRGAHSALVAAFIQAPAHRPMGTGRDVTGLRKDGTEFPVEIGLNPLRTSEGTWVIASVIDLTERKRLDMQIQEHHERVQAYWEAASEGLLTVDASGTIEMVNKGTERIFGYDRSELVGQPLELVIPEAQRHAHAEKRERYFADPQLRSMGMGHTLSGRRKDGTLFPVEVGLNVARIGGRTVAIGFVTDITEKRRLEEQSAALGTLVDLQQQLSTSSRRSAANGDPDPLTGLDTRAMLHEALEKEFSDPKGLCGIIYSVQRLGQMNQRFGSATADRILVFASQYIANSLNVKGDQLFRWDRTTFVALVRRDSPVLQVQREVTLVCGKRLEYFVKHAGGSSLVMIALRANVLTLSQVLAADAVTEIERLVRLVPRG
jgi:PAS domain S-box-containing protein